MWHCLHGERCQTHVLLDLPQKEPDRQNHTIRWPSQKAMVENLLTGDTSQGKSISATETALIRMECRHYLAILVDDIIANFNQLTIVGGQIIVFFNMCWHSSRWALFSLIRFCASHRPFLKRNVREKTRIQRNDLKLNRHIFKLKSSK